MLVALFVTMPVIRASAEIRNWHDPSFDTRAIVRVDRPARSDIDTAIAHVTHAGLAQLDGDDFRVFDATGKPVSYELLYHTPDRDSLIAFEVPGEGGDYAIYFNNPDAARDPLRVDSAKAVAAGRADEGWLPRAGLVLTTMRRPRDTPNPMTEAQMRTMIEQSPRIDGGGLVRNISHGVNPYGNSDYYISVYRGWLRIPEDGRYVFCTASNEASFSFLNGRELIHWPGRHTDQRGKHGQKQATHQLKRGLYFVEYLHEDVLLDQTAFLGWKKPGDKHLWSIPDDMFPRPHEAAVLSYEDRNGGLFAMPRVELVDSLWPAERSSGQWTRFRFIADAGQTVGVKPNRWSFTWNFGDGQTAEGQDVEHLFLSEGVKTVELQVKNSRGDTVTLKRPVEVFAIEHMDKQTFKEGDFATYRKLAESLAVERLPAEDLQSLLVMYEQAGDTEQTHAVAKQMLQHPKLNAEQKVSAHLTLAGAVGEPSWIWLRSDDPANDQAGLEHLKLAADASPDHFERARILSRAYRAKGILGEPTGDTTKAMDHLIRVQANMPMADRIQASRLKAMAMGDVALWKQHDLVQALQAYKRAEQYNRPQVPRQVRVAQVGGFPETIRQFAQAGNPEQALATVEHWQDTYPSDQLNGKVLFQRAKLLDKKQSKLAKRAVVRLMKKAIELGQGSPWEAEARYRLAQAYRTLGDEMNYRANLRALIDSGLVGEWRQRAIQEMP